MINCLICLIDWLIDWLSDWLIVWLIDWLTGWVIDCLINWLSDWLIDWLTGWLSDCLNWLIDCIARVIGCLIDWLIDWLADWLSYWLIDWLIDCLINWLIDWSSDACVDDWRSVIALSQLWWKWCNKVDKQFLFRKWYDQRFNLTARKLSLNRVQVQVKFIVTHAEVVGYHMMSYYFVVSQTQDFKRNKKWQQH